MRPTAGLPPFRWTLHVIISMAAAHVILLVALLIAAWTDIRRHRIPNAVTYPALVACLLAALLDEGSTGLLDAILGMVVCGGLMALAWLADAVGGGDVKLAAVMGAALGWADGLYALMWTFTFAAIWMLSRVVWREGFRATLNQLCGQRRPRLDRAEISTNEPAEARPLFLAPAALMAVALIVMQSTGWPRFD